MLPEFSLDKTLVTNGQFRRFVDVTKYRTAAEKARDERNWRINDTPEKANYPVVFVTKQDAIHFCNWAGKRLPTADEWKKAYRGPQGRVYPWGDQFDYGKCNTAESCHGYQTTPVEMFLDSASEYGCLDLMGNVEEWTSTTIEDNTVILGGSWKMSCEVYGLPVLHRLGSPTLYLDDLGFRCACDE
jgi:formylglycine-generating enzyme required for sulfatase activity